MKVAFDVGKVLAHANMCWRDALTASGLQYVECELVDQYLYDFPPYLPYEGGQVPQEEYLTGLSDAFGLFGPEEGLHLHRSIIGDEYPGVADVIRDLHAAGIETATLSNNNPIHWAWFTESGKYPAIEMIERKIASFQLGYFKPDPLIFSKFCEVTGWEPSEIVFLDDAEKNVLAAIAAGWTAFQINEHEPQAAQIRRILNLN